MKKKIAIILGVIFLCLVIVGTSVLAFANSTQETVYEIHENKVICSLKTYDETATGKVTIPENYNGIMVTGINENAFLKCSDVTEVVVPKTVVNIGEFSLGYILNENGEKVKKENFVIWGRGNSEAQKYAEENDRCSVCGEKLTQNNLKECSEYKSSGMALRCYNLNEN